MKRTRLRPISENLLNIENQVPLCVFHNGWVENHPLDAHRIGLAMHMWERE